MKRRYLSDTVAEQISDYIDEQKLSPGDRLPSVAEWMERLQVGRSTLREGLKKLETAGTIQVINGKGIFVGEQQALRIFSQLTITNGRRHLLEMLDVRQLLEKFAVTLATLNAQEQHLNAMAGYLNEYREALDAGDLSRVHEADAAFHWEIYLASGNRVLMELTRSIYSELYVAWETSADRHSLFDAGFPHHLDLLDAMRRHDTSDAEKAFDRLITATREQVARLL